MTELKLIESQDVDVKGTPYINTAANGIHVSGSYTVGIYQYTTGFVVTGFVVKALCRTTGNALSDIVAPTLGLARKEAQRRATILQSTSEEVLWKPLCYAG